jgi:hypothetical protein
LSSGRGGAREHGQRLISSGDVQWMTAGTASYRKCRKRQQKSVGIPAPNLTSHKRGSRYGT